MPEGFALAEPVDMRRVARRESFQGFGVPRFVLVPEPWNQRSAEPPGTLDTF
jgi:hypothetical protein